MLIDFTLIIIGYLLGSIPSAYVVAKLAKGIDIREYGSKSTTGANATRVLGFKLGFTAGMLDIIKGVIATLLAVLVIGSDSYDSSDALFEKNVLIALTGFAAIVGHCFSLYLKFTGGKGAATFLGVLLVFSPWTALAVFITWWVVIGVTRYTSLGNLVMVWASLLTLMFAHDFDFGHTLLGILIIPFVYFTHRTNISRLLKGEERKLGKKIKVEETTTEEPVSSEEE
ncbi:MAG: glycerol-3-phosphate 1-O-acyltransferase PlsY [Candidatus Kariarchaeaceae archaeon]